MEAEGAAGEGQGPTEDVDAGSDELLLDGSEAAEDEPPVSRRARMFGGGSSDGADASAAASKPAGSTLFERMANLSRAASDAPNEGEEDEEEEGGSSLRIPRFLGRQNNQ